MDIEIIKEKSTFVVALLATALAFTAFKEELNNIPISFGIYNTNLLKIIILFFILLAFSTYLYSLNFVRIGTKYQNHYIFNWLFSLANFSYIVTLVYPLLVIMIWCIAWVITIIAPFLKLSIITLNLITALSSLLSTLFMIVISFKTSQSYTKNTFLKSANLIKVQIELLMQIANSLYIRNLYSESILELFKVVELSIKKKLESKGKLTNNLNIKQLIEIGLKEKIISKVDLNIIKDILKLRKQILNNHQSIMTKNDANYAFKLVTILLNDL